MREASYTDLASSSQSWSKLDFPKLRGPDRVNASALILTTPNKKDPEFVERVKQVPKRETVHLHKQGRGPALQVWNARRDEVDTPGIHWADAALPAAVLQWVSSSLGVDSIWNVTDMSIYMITYTYMICYMSIYVYIDVHIYIHITNTNKSKHTSADMCIYVYGDESHWLLPVSSYHCCYKAKHEAVSQGTGGSDSAVLTMVPLALTCIAAPN